MWLLLVVATAWADWPCSPACTATQNCSMGQCIDMTIGARDAKYNIRLRATNRLEPEIVSLQSDCSRPTQAIALNSCANASVPDCFCIGYASPLLGGPDTRWLHLHRGSSLASTGTVTVNFIQADECYGSHQPTGIQLRYRVWKYPVTGWLDPPYTWNADVNAANFDTTVPVDGVFHLTVDIRATPGQTPVLTDYTPNPIFIHIKRGGAIPTSYMVPVGIDEPDEPDTDVWSSPMSNEPIYIDIRNRKYQGYPANPALTGWQGPPHLADLYVEQMSPRSLLFLGLQMWWADPFHDDLPFVRAWPPKHDEDHRGLRVNSRHERFPAKDGPRGVGWMSPYVGGEVDSQGRFAFAEISGRVGYMYPDGTIKTVAGWVTDPNKDPVWYKKPTVTVRSNQILRGTWLNGIWPGETGGFHTPLDVAIDPNNEQIWYVVGVEDNAIWKVVITNLPPVTNPNGHNVQVSVFAGSLTHAAGRADGVGTAATFDGPTSLVFDPVKKDRIYVSDQNNGRIRMIMTATGAVTTLFGATNVKLTGNSAYPFAPAGYQSACPTWWDQVCARSNAKVTTSAGTQPDIFVPHVVRCDSLGNLYVMSHGFGTIQKINLNTNATTIAARHDTKHTQWDRGWMWMDIDRWGNSGDKDGIYWLKMVGEIFGQSHGPMRGDPGCTYLWKNIDCTTASRCSKQGDYRCPDNTATNMFSENYGYVPPNNNDQKSYLLFNQDATSLPKYGPHRTVEPPHYPWLIAVDPRGGVLFAGVGVHVINRLRLRRPSDPMGMNQPTVTSWDHYYNYWNGRRLYTDGTMTAKFGETMINSIGPLVLFGYDGHNLLGMNDTWGFVGASNQTLLDSFQIPQAIQSSTEGRTMTMQFLGNSRGSTTGTPNIVQCYGIGCSMNQECSNKFVCPGGVSPPTPAPTFACPAAVVSSPCNVTAASIRLCQCCGCSCSAGSNATTGQDISCSISFCGVYNSQPGCRDAHSAYATCWNDEQLEGSNQVVVDKATECAQVTSAAALPVVSFIAVALCALF